MLQRRVEARMVAAVGGRTRLRVVAVLAGVLALDSADKASIGAVAPQLERALGIGNVQIGLLATVTAAVSALATLPLGVLADRGNRVHLLLVAILLWSAAMVGSGASGSFVALLLIRVVLGVGAAAAGPTIGSLIGDLFETDERGRIYGFVLAGELLGGGIGFLVSGDVAAVLSWRWAFWCLGALGVALAAVLARFLPEPERGGGSRLPRSTGSATGRADESRAVARMISERGITARDGLVLHEDPAGKPLRWAVRYVLAIPTNRALILASALSYYFFSGLRTFAVVFVRGRFGLSQSAASSLLVLIGSGAIAGTLVAGRLSDHAVTRGHVSARPVVGGISLLAAALFFLPGLLVPGLVVAAPLFFLGAAGFGGANPPVDAARLDVMHYRLRGRAEAVRSVCRTIMEALAPLCFGLVAALFGAAGTNAAAPGTEEASGSALDHTLLIMLVALVAGGLVLCIRASRTYPRDVASALASERGVAADEAG